MAGDADMGRQLAEEETAKGGSCYSRVITTDLNGDHK